MGMGMAGDSEADEHRHGIGRPDKFQRFGRLYPAARGAQPLA